MSTSTANDATANAWVYKCNREKQPYASAFGDWDRLFRHDRPTEWGGSWCTTNSMSTHILNEEIRTGDLVIAYQTDERAIVGICRVAAITGRVNDRTLRLKPAHRFPSPIPIHDLKATIPSLATIKAFKPGFPQMLYPLVQGERKLLERVCKVNLTARGTEPILPPKMRDHGAGFGDPEQNRKVETAAVSFVKQWYRQRDWDVATVERDRCGYDLRCEKRGLTQHVEVKGIAGSEPNFIITANELTQAKSNETFVIWIVTDALSRKRSGKRLTGKQLCERFSFRPLQFCATPKP